MDLVPQLRRSDEEVGVRGGIRRAASFMFHKEIMHIPFANHPPQFKPSSSKSFLPDTIFYLHHSPRKPTMHFTKTISLISAVFASAALAGPIEIPQAAGDIEERQYFVSPAVFPVATCNNGCVNAGWTCTEGIDECSGQVPDCAFDVMGGCLQCGCSGN